MEVNMRRLLWVSPLLFVLISSGARSNSFNIYLEPNEGFGDNLAIGQQSGGMTLFLVGGTQTGFFDSFGYAPGSTLGGFGTVYLDFGTAQIGGVNYDLAVTTGSLFMSSITLPTNGASTVTDSVVLSFTASATIAATGQIINVSGSSAGKITFVMGYDGQYYAGAFTPTPTPEPGTVGFIGSGLVGVLSVARRRRRIWVRKTLRGLKFGRPLSLALSSSGIHRRQSAAMLLNQA